MSVTTAIENISNHLKNAYDELQGLGADLTNVNKNIENISIVLDDIYDSMPQVRGEGTDLTLDDTRVGKIKSTLKGNTSQNETPTPTTPIPINVVSGDNSIVVCGKNLAPTDWASKFVSTVNNTFRAKLETKDNRNCLWYRPEAGYNYYPTQNFTLDMTFKENTQYTISFDWLKESATNPTLDIEYTDGTVTTITSANNVDVWEHKTLISTANKTIKNIHPRYTAGSTYIDIDTWQIEEGTTETTYEPYKNASYPISLGVENLWTLSDTFTSTSANQWVLGDTNFELKAGTYYLDINATINKNVAFNFKDSNNTATAIYLSSTNTITFANDIKKVSIRIDTANNTISNIRLIKGNKAQHISTTPIELCKIGDYQDSIIKDNGKWYLNKQIGKILLNGTETFDGGSGTRWNYIPTLPPKLGSATSPNAMSNYYTSKFSTDNNSIYVSGTYQYISIMENRFSNVSDFKTWLASNNVTIYYVLATPTYTEITDSTLINQLEALKKAVSYNEQTNISQESNDLPFILNVSALKKNSNN